MKIYSRVFLLMCMILFALPVLATEETAADNACYEGGSLAGKCDWPTEAETEWAWMCGWYIARAENGTLTPGDVPSWCGYIKTAPNDTIAVPTGCIDSSTTSIRDMRFVGPINTFSNVLFFTSTNSTCQSLFGIITSGTVVDAASSSDANDRCAALLAGNSATLLTNDGYPMPATWYRCIP